MVTIPARQARAFRVIDNRTSELTSWDTDLLPDALSGLNDLDIFSFDDVLPPAATAGKTGPDDIPETPKKPVTCKGDLWVLGKHRIVCGDSTDQKTVARLLDGAEPALMVTDPPYGVSYDSSWRYKAGISTKDGAFGKSANDDQNDWQVAYGLFPGKIAYVWMSSLALSVAQRGLEACGFIPRSLIIWDKGHIVIGRGHYHWRHESCWYAVKKAAQANWTGDRKASTIWEIDNPANLKPATRPRSRSSACSGPSTTTGRRLRSVRRLGHHGDRRRAGGAKRLRHGDRACLRRRDGQAVGGVHRPKGQEDDKTPWQVNALPLPRPPARQRKPHPSRSRHGRMGKRSVWR